MVFIDIKNPKIRISIYALNKGKNKVWGMLGESLRILLLYYNIIYYTRYIKIHRLYYYKNIYSTALLRPIKV